MSAVSAPSIPAPIFDRFSPKDQITEDFYEGFSPAVEDLIERCHGNYKEFDIEYDGQEGWGYDMALSAVECKQIMTQYLQKKKPESGFSALAIGEMTSTEIEEDSYLVVHGDTHADLYGLLQRLEYLKEKEFLTDGYKVSNDPDKKVRVVFLGDYFGRGLDSVKLFMFLLAFKIENWDAVDLYRGNHESLSRVKKDVVGREQSFFDDPDFVDLLNLVFSTLTIRGYYCCPSKDAKKRTEHVVMAHGVPGFYPMAQEVIKSKKKIISKSDEIFLDMNVVGKSKIPNKALKKILIDIPENDYEQFDEKEKDILLILAAKKVYKFITENFARLEKEWTKAHLLEFWGDVDLGEVRRNGVRKTSFYFPPNFIKSICRIHSDKHNKIVAVITGHFHSYREFSVQGKRHLKKGFIHQMPATGDNQELSVNTDNVDLFSILRVKPRIKDWKQSLIVRDCTKGEFMEIDEVFYGNVPKKLRTKNEALKSGLSNLIEFE